MHDYKQLIWLSEPDLLCDVVCFAYHTHFTSEHSFLLHPPFANKKALVGKFDLVIEW